MSSSSRLEPDLAREWLEADGLGGFASGTVGLVRTRRYHALLLAASTPPTGRAVLVAGFDAFVDRGGDRQAISCQAYAEGVVSPVRTVVLESFESEPWPRWLYRLPDGALLSQEIFAVHGESRVVVAWSLIERASETLPGRLIVRPFLAGRDYHSLVRAGSDRAMLLEPPTGSGEDLVFALPASLPRVRMRTSGRYVHAPFWYRDFLLAEEQSRGFDHHEDLASPGEISFDLAAGPAWWVVEAEPWGFEDRPKRAVGDSRASRSSEPDSFEGLRERERQRRARFATPLDRAADAYLVRRGAGLTLVAGYPWFTDWGRDTFIALRGLCLARGELDTARTILLEWAGAIVEGVLPNRFADQGEMPEYNAVDASLWYVVCIEELLRAYEGRGLVLSATDDARLSQAVDSILTGYARGTRHAIHLDRDGLLAAGEQGVQLTWMDAKVGDLVVTPRIGKPVEVQALWWNALRCGERFDSRWAPLAERAREAFLLHFWNSEREILYDVIDVDHVNGALDPRFRPNQIFAIGGLPYALLEGERAARIVRACEEALWTPDGLRSLAPGEPDYALHYAGGPRERDLAYHQGTVWPWLAGPFVEAWLRVRGNSPSSRDEARSRFVTPLRERLDLAGIGHLSEIADAEPPHAPRGCPFQAWSLAELIRLERGVLSLPIPEACSPRSTKRVASEDPAWHPTS